MKLKYYINNEELIFEAPDETNFFYGDKVCLSKKFKDISQGCDWYSEGYTVLDFSNYININLIKKSLEDILKRIISEVSPATDLKNFELKNYHKYINNYS